MDEYELLLKELEALLKARHALQCEDLIAWGREKNVGPVTLLSLVEDLIQKGIAEASIEQELIDDFLELSLPKRLSLRQQRALSPSHAPRVTQPRRKRREKTERRGELLRFLYEGEEEVEESVGGEGGEIGPQTRQEALEKAPVIKEEERKERSYVAALQYLYKFWSVGELRFEADMKSMGVQDAAAILRRLQSEGLVEMVEPGVINAKRELIEKKLKELSHSLSSSPLADLFS